MMSEQGLNELMAYIDLCEEGKTLQPRIEQYTKSKQAEIDQTTATLSRDLLAKQEEINKKLTNAVKEIEDLPFDKTGDAQIANAQGILKTMRLTQSELTEKNRMATQTAGAEKEKLAALQHYATELRKQFENAPAQRAPFQRELDVLGNRVPRAIGNVPEIIKRT